MTSSGCADDLQLPSFDEPIGPKGAIEHGNTRLQFTPAELRTPAMVISDEALQHNLESMADYCRRHAAAIAPHGKTTMSPQLIRRQMAAGAWGITAASTRQARLFLSWGAERVFIANQVTDPAQLQWLAEVNSTDRLVTMQVDSREGVELANQSLASNEAAIPTLVEIGIVGGRTGVRSADAATDLARAVLESPVLKLTGVTGFEGIIGGPNGPERLRSVREYLASIGDAAVRLAKEGLMSKPILSAGGTSFFVQVVEVLGPIMDRLGGTLLVRSGCYLTSDHGVIANNLVAAGAGQDPGLVPAMQVWTRVLSRPEPTMAVLDAGRRDCSFDAGMPTIEEIVGLAGDSREPPSAMRVERMNDQHAIVVLDPEDDLSVGEVLRLGPAHPCTVFDKWRQIPVVAADGRVIEIAETYF